MIYIEVIHQRWLAGVNIIKDRSELKQFQEYVAQQYVRQVRMIAYQQKYQSKMAPLSDDYLMYKISHGLHQGQWVATGELINHLEVKGDGRIVGFDRRRKHSKAKVPYTNLARWLEYGTLTIPPRPLLRLVYIRMRKDIRYWYNKWLEENNVT